MEKALKINFILVTVLSLTAGIPKIIQIPEETQFFQSLGLSTTTMLIFGVIQLLGGVLLIIKKTRLFGALIADLTFTLSAVMIFMAGKILFGFISLIPIFMAMAVIFEIIITMRNKNA